MGNQTLGASITVHIKHSFSFSSDNNTMGQPYSVEVHGTVAPGYESVKNMFEDNFKQGREDSAQLCVYVGEELVVDLYASLSSPTYNGDTLTNVFSSTKSLTAICMARTVDRGLLDYKEKISKYWAEFAQNGKGETTVADLMRHEAGLPSFDISLPRESLLPANIKKNKIGAVIEKQEQSFPSETLRRQYHAVTRGWIANEVFRRVEPSGATIGEHLQSIADDLSADVHIGVEGKHLANYCPVSHMSGAFVFRQSFIPKSLGRAIDPNIINLLGLMMIFRKFAKDVAKKAPAFVGLTAINEEWNDEDVRRGEIPSANGNCSARGFALLAVAMANGGSYRGCTILSPAGWQALHEAPKDGMMYTRNMKFTQGGVAKFEEEDTSETNGRLGYYGWMGYGGSVFQWHPELKIGFGYVPTLLTWIDLTNNKGRLLQEEVRKCAAALNKA